MQSGTSNEQHLSTSATNGVNTVRESLLIKVLQEVANRGWLLEWDQPAPPLRWWQRIQKYFGRVYPQYIRVRKARYLTELERDAIYSFLATIVPEPRCKWCGGTNLDADPAGYYYHAEDFRGAPLLCLDAESQRSSHWPFSASGQRESR
jgi:hypothetical protein